MFIEELSEELSDIDTVYDLAALSYDYLIENINDHPKFLSNYIFENERATVNNPNLQSLREYQKNIVNVLNQQENSGWMFSECLSSIIALSENMEKQLVTYLDDMENLATIPFFILLSINQYVPNKKGRNTAHAPLNRSYCKHSYVYLNISDNIIDEAAYLLDFSSTISKETIRKQLNHLCFLEKAELQNFVHPLVRMN